LLITPKLIYSDSLYKEHIKSYGKY